MTQRTLTVRTVALAAIATFALTSVIASPALASEGEKVECTKEAPCVLRIRTVAPKASPWGQLLAALKKRIRKETDERVKVKVYWQSKSEPAAVRQCIRGKVGGIAVSNGALSSAVPELMGTEIPFLFDNYAQADKALAAANDLIRAILEKRGFIYAIRGENGFRHFASKLTFFETPADIAGQSMRSQPAKHHIAMYKALGATPNPIQVAEVPSSLTNNTVTGYDNTLLFGDLAAWADGIKYITLSAHIYQGAIVAWCKPWFDTLPDDIQAVLTKKRPKLEKTGLDLVRAFNDDEMPAKYKSKDKKIKTLSASQRAAFKAKTAVVETRFRNKAGADGNALLDKLQANR